MLYMVIEHFRNADPTPIGDRFKSGPHAARGPNVPSKLDRPKDSRCFQVVETQDPALLTAWIKNWDDLIDFEIIPVQSSAEYWSKREVP